MDAIEIASPEPESALNFDRMVRARLGKLTMSLSPPGLLLVFLDWWIHFLFSPGKQQQLAVKFLRKLLRFNLYVIRRSFNPETPPVIEPMPQDDRFRDPAWSQWPFNLYYQSFLLLQQWVHNATTGIRGVSPHDEQVVSFACRQLLDVFAPANYPWSNPEVLQTTYQQGGRNLIEGAINALEDGMRWIEGRRLAGSESFQVGKDVAVTPGKVIHRNRLMELIQYQPTTSRVHAEPMLIVPAWIMKYYILDLSPHNSLVRFLVDQGHTVFMISWKNPGPEDRDLGLDDYRTLGILEALKAIAAIRPERPVDVVGYCLGGTLAAIATAALTRDRDNRVNTLTLLAAETDFHDAGELMLFIDETEVAFLEDIMWDQGYLDSRQMAGAFQLLRSNDLIWSRLVHHYLMGRREPLTDLMAWNSDATRMPFRMHSEYLRKLFLHNELAEGKFQVGGRPVTLTDIRAPVFAVGTQRDHVAPWRSVFKIHLLADTEVTFLLTAGGHNAGIVSEPGHRHRSYQIATRRELDPYIDPDRWAATTPTLEGSWWPAWHDWLAARSSGTIDPPNLGAPEAGFSPLAPAPGTYVLMP